MKKPTPGATVVHRSTGQVGTVLRHSPRTPATPLRVQWYTGRPTNEHPDNLQAVQLNSATVELEFEYMWHATAFHFGNPGRVWCASRKLYHKVEGDRLAAKALTQAARTAHERGQLATEPTIYTYHTPGE